MFFTTLFSNIFFSAIVFCLLSFVWLPHILSPEQNKNIQPFFFQVADLRRELPWPSQMATVTMEGWQISEASTAKTMGTWTVLPQSCLDVPGRKLGSVGYSPYMPHLEVGEITHLLTIYWLPQTFKWWKWTIVPFYFLWLFLARKHQCSTEVWLWEQEHRLWHLWCIFNVIFSVILIDTLSIRCIHWWNLWRSCASQACNESGCKVLWFWRFANLVDVLLAGVVLALRIWEVVSRVPLIHDPMFSITTTIPQWSISAIATCDTSICRQIPVCARALGQVIVAYDNHLSGCTSLTDKGMMG